MNPSVCCELSCDGLVTSPGGIKDSLKLGISAGSVGHKAHKGFTYLLKIESGDFFISNYLAKLISPEVNENLKSKQKNSALEISIWQIKIL